MLKMLRTLIDRNESQMTTLKATFDPFVGALTIVRSLSAKYRPDRYRGDKSVKFGTELP